MFGVWEPLLEPLEIDQTEDFRPWNLGIKVYLKSEKFSKIEDAYTTEGTLIFITTKFKLSHYEPCFMLSCLTSECNFQTEANASYAFSNTNKYVTYVLDTVHSVFLL